MHTAVFHSVNSGLYLWDGENGLLVDGIHQGREEGCSPMPEFLSMQMRRGSGLFAHLNGLLFTHLHRDHYDPARVHCLLREHPELPFYTPGSHCGPTAVCSVRRGECTVRMGSAYILARNTVHDGERFRGDAHQSYLIRMGGETFFIAGDAALTPEDAAAFSGFYGGEVDAGFFNLYQLSSPQGQDFLRILCPRRIFLEHLPFREDDRFHYRSLARQAARSLPEDLPRVEILPHMSWIDGKAAQWEPHEKGEMTDDLSGIPQHRSLL